MYDYDWFRGEAYSQQVGQARLRCTFRRFPDLSPGAELTPEAASFRDELHVRVLIYLRDGFSYELKELVEMDSKAHLTFECEPVEDQYKVGSFIVSVPYEDVVRVEVFAVHPTERPEDTPVITGFRNAPEQQQPQPRDDGRARKVTVTTEEFDV